MVSRQFHVETQIIETSVVGKYRLNELLLNLEEIRTEHRDLPVLLLLSDYREGEVQYKLGTIALEISDTNSLIKEVSREHKAVFSATVLKKVKNEGFLKFFRSLSKPKNYGFKKFESKEDAINWLIEMSESVKSI